MVQADPSRVRSAQVGRRLKNVHIRPKHRGVGLEHDEGESADVGDEPDHLGVESAPSGFESDQAEVGLNIVVVRPKPSGGGPKQLGVESDDVGLPSADSRCPCRPRG